MNVTHVQKCFFVSDRDAATISTLRKLSDCGHTILCSLSDSIHVLDSPIFVGFSLFSSHFVSNSYPSQVGTMCSLVQGLNAAEIQFQCRMVSELIMFAALPGYF